MPRVKCQNEYCPDFGESMDLIEEDSRQEWYSAIYECDECGQRKEHKKIYTQDGAILSDDIFDL